MNLYINTKVNNRHTSTQYQVGNKAAQSKNIKQFLCCNSFFVLLMYLLGNEDNNFKLYNVIRMLNLSGDDWVTVSISFSSCC